MTGAEISVVIPVRNGARTIRACLDAIAAQEGAPVHEVVVVDNGSTDATATIARGHAVVNAVVPESREGSYAARNAGIAATSAPLLAFVDADCVPRPGWLAALAAALDDAGLAGGEVTQRRRPDANVWERYDRATYLRQADLVERGFAATANLGVRRAVLDDVGAFDAGMRSSGDYELGLRATGAGHRLVHAAAAEVLHEPRTTPRATWQLHRRLGAGWRALVDRGLLGPADAAALLDVDVEWVFHLVEQDGPPVRRRTLRAVHEVAQRARRRGYATGR